MEIKSIESEVSTSLKSIERWRSLVARALGRAGLSQKQAAAEMGISEAQLSRQLAGTENLSFWKMHTLPPSFWEEVLTLIADYHDICLGQSQRDREDVALGREFRELARKAIAR